MSAPLKVLHITSHLGGGVGRCLSALSAHNRTKNEIEDSFLCLDQPCDSRYMDKLIKDGAKIHVAPAFERVRAAIERADIVQLEWWHHPLMAGLLPGISDIPARWVIWSHISGLHYPAIPSAFIEAPNAFLTTTPASQHLLGEGDNLRSNVASTGGFDDMPAPKSRKGGPQIGYMGALNPAKLHPDIIHFLESVNRPNFKVDFFGDSSVNPSLELYAANHGPESVIKLCGFIEKPQKILPSLEIFPYILNPLHYGSTENALLEAMACGAVPIVLNNPVETSIIEDGITGFVVKNPETFAQAVHKLLDDNDLRKRMSAAASRTTRRDYSVANSSAKFFAIYTAINKQKKKTLNFKTIFGEKPADMFLSCLGSFTECFAKGNENKLRSRRLSLPFLYERTKSSAFHFHTLYPKDQQLAIWCKMLENDRAEASC